MSCGPIIGTLRDQVVLAGITGPATSVFSMALDWDILLNCLILFVKMSAFNLEESLRRAERRFSDRPGSRRPRRDRGRSRLALELETELERLLRGQERPPVRVLMERLGRYCRANGLNRPARATVYKAMTRTPPRGHTVTDLPSPVQEALYNLRGTAEVPGHQLAFYCLNYGDLAAISFAAGLPWLALYQAARLPGWRPRSRGLLGAILRTRGI